MSELPLPDKKATWEEVFKYALIRYKNNESRALSFTRGWFNVS